MVLLDTAGVLNIIVGVSGCSCVLWKTFNFPGIRSNLQHRHTHCRLGVRRTYPWGSGFQYTALGRPEHVKHYSTYIRVQS